MRTSRLPDDAAIRVVNSSHGHPFFRSHFKVSRWPPEKNSSNNDDDNNTDNENHRETYNTNNEHHRENIQIVRPNTIFPHARHTTPHKIQQRSGAAPCPDPNVAKRGWLATRVTRPTTACSTVASP